MTIFLNRILAIASLGAIALALALQLAGCSLHRNSPYSTPTAEMRDPNKAQALTMQAGDILERDQKQAEKLLCEALSADIYYGPAHNDLGVVCLRQGRLYEAANEFEWARKLMPGHPDPRMNLALTLEKAGRVDEALAAYDSALEVYPNHIPTLQALTRLQLRYRKKDDRTSEMLREVELSGETPKWRDWARRQLIEIESSSR